MDLKSITIFSLFILTCNILFASEIPCREPLQTHVNSLVNSSKSRYYENPDILDSIASYIHVEFQKYGFDNISEQNYEVKGKQYKNVIASIGPEDSEHIVVGAHYDVYGPFPGADDNASGVAGLLECARQIYSQKDKLKYRVEFVAYTLEEPPFFNTRFMGSYIHASYLSDNCIKVKLMISLDMIGYYSDQKKSQKYPFGLLKPLYGDVGDYSICFSNFKSRKYAKTLSRTFNESTSLKSKYLIAPARLGGISFSDHRNFWGYKIPAILISDWAYYRNNNYHSPEDLPGSLDFNKMVEVVNGTVKFLTTLK